MAYKRFGGWLIDEKLFIQMKISNELWDFSRRDGTEERQVNLFFIGWYDKGKRTGGKLFTVNILWVILQVGFNLK